MRKSLQISHSRVKEIYLENLNLVTNEDNRDMVRIGIFYLITSYLFSISYKRIVENYLFALVENFDTMGMFPWTKDFFELSINSLKKWIE